MVAMIVGYEQNVAVSHDGVDDRVGDNVLLKAEASRQVECDCGFWGACNERVVVYFKDFTFFRGFGVEFGNEFGESGADEVPHGIAVVETGIVKQHIEVAQSQAAFNWRADFGNESVESLVGKLIHASGLVFVVGGSLAMKHLVRVLFLGIGGDVARKVQLCKAQLGL